MSRPSSEALIAELTRDLAPVRRIPPPGGVGLALVGLWAAGCALSGWLGGSGLRAGPPGALGEPVFTGLLAALALAGAGGSVAAVARAVPGRERLARTGSLFLALGLGLALGCAGLAWLVDASATSLPAAAACASHALGLGLAPAVLAFAWLARAWEPRPRAGAAVASLTAAALGACAVHLRCSLGDAGHLLLGHALGPLLAATLLALLGHAWLVRHAAAR